MQAKVNDNVFILSLSQL